MAFLHRLPRRHRASGAIATLGLATFLTACAGDQAENGNDATDGADNSTLATTTTAETTATPSSGQETRTTETSTSKSSRGNENEPESVDEVAQQFSTLAPPELFKQLEACTSTGMEGSYDCSGPEIGQFQFFDSESKAASTTQLLTELRSSRLVEDKGDRVVGWSVLGTSAIITVVDNEAGQVMQQLISTDQEDPRKRIYELGLADQVDTVVTPGHSAADSTTSTTATRR